MKLFKLNQGGWSLHIILPAIAIIAVGAIGLKTMNNSGAATCRSYQYGPGVTSTCVKYIQQMINNVSWLYNGTPLTVDGKFGPATTAQVKLFQKNALQSSTYGVLIPAVTADGYVGPKTWDKLCKSNMLYNVFRYGSSTPLKMTSAGVNAGCPTSFSSYTWVRL